MGLGVPVTEPGGDPEPLLEACGELSVRSAECHRDVAGGDPQRGHLQPAVAHLVGEREGGVDVADGLGVARGRLVGASAGEQHARPQRGVPSGLERAVEQVGGVVDRRSAHRRAAREPPAVRGAVGLTGGVRVGGHRLRPVAEGVGRAPVQGGGEGRGQRVVHALLDQVVDHLVLRAGTVHQPHPHELLALLDGGQLGQVAHVRQAQGVHPATGHAGELEHPPGLLLEPLRTQPDRLRERARDAGLALAQGTQGLHDAERMPRRSLQHLLRTGGQARRLGKRLDGGRRQRAERDRRRDVGQVDHPGDVVGADRGEEQHAHRTEPPAQVAEQVDRRGAALLQVVDREQHRTSARQPAKHDRHRVVGAAALHGRARTGTRPRLDQLGQLRHEVHPLRGVTVEQLTQARGTFLQQHRAECVDVRLEEQGAFGRPAPRAQHEAAGRAGQLGGRAQYVGLADAGFAVDDDQPAGARGGRRPGAVQHGQLVLATDRRRPSSRRVPGVVAVCRERLLAQQGEVERRGRRVGVGAELVAQPARHLVVRRERGRRSSVGGERPHQLA